jgi:hypothetical protein
MDLEQQLQMLVDEAPKYDVPGPIMSQIINPVLKMLAQELNYLEYYIPQTREQDWIITTLSNREQPHLEKKVIYAFGTLNDALIFSAELSQETIPMAMPVTRLILQLLSLEQVDSIIFMDHSDNPEKGTEIKQSSVQKLIETQLKQLNNIPYNIA